METNRLKHFCMIYETVNMRKAAELLHISHSGISKSIKTLEQELGFQLITAQGRGIAITDAGRMFYPKAQKILQHVEDVLSPKQSTETNQQIRIATFEVFSTYFFGKLAEDEFNNNSAVFTLREAIPGQLEQALLDHSTDFGITYIPIPRPGIQYSKVSTLQMKLFSANKKFDQLPLDQIPFAAPAIPISGSPTTVRGLDGWPDDKHPRNIRYRVDMMESALELCRRGMAVIYAPEFIVKLHNKQVNAKSKLHPISTLKKIKSSPKPVYIVRRSSTVENRIMKKIARCLRQTLNEK